MKKLGVLISAALGLMLAAGCSASTTEDEDDAERDEEPANVGKSEQAYSGADGYFHPNNGAHGGWIESWRLCHKGGNQYYICRGGYAPVRYWNPSSCGGNIHNYYPQGWNGWVQTWGGCS